jgi:hypothetical protein
MSTTIVTGQELDRFTPATQEALRIAQREAARMEATSIDPEHLLLGIIMQGDERVMNLMGALGMDVQTARRRASEVARPQDNLMMEEIDLPLSREAQECVAWALAFVAHMYSSAIFPDHLLIGVLRHQRTQPLLSFLLPSTEELQTRISEAMGTNYTAYIDQLVQSKVRDQSVVSYGRGASLRVLRKFERPTATFIDVLDLDRAKRELRDVVEFLKATPMFQLSGGRYPHGVLLTGSMGNERRLLVQATAGEAVVPLITLSMPALMEMLIDLQSGAMRFEDLALPVREYNLLRRGSTSEKGQRYIQYIFQQAKDVAPSILYIEDIDALAKLGKNEGRDQIVRQVLSEMDAIEKQYRMVAIASADHPDTLDPALLRAGRFEHQISLESRGAQPGAGRRFCAACRREVLPDWQYCVYCGASQARVCSQCGAPLPELAGARFCAACGSALPEPSTV